MELVIVFVNGSRKYDAEASYFITQTIGIIGNLVSDLDCNVVDLSSIDHLATAKKIQLT